MKYEDVINKIQGNGRFTMAMMLILSVINFQAAVNVMNIIFITFTPKFKCASAVQNRSDVDNFNWTISECSAKFVNSTSNSTVNFKCDSWIYDKSVLTSTLVTEFNLVCEKAHFVTTISTLLFCGIAFGNFIGVVSDYIGRKKHILIMCGLEIVINCIIPLIPNLWVIIALQFLWGLCFSKAHQTIGLMMELVSSNKRAFYGNNIWAFWVLGYMVLPLIQYLAKYWRTAKWISNSFYIFYGLLFFLPESPRWLSLKGHKKEAKKTLRMIARRNKAKNIQDDSFDNIEVTIETGKLSNILFCNVLRLKLIVGIVALCSISLGYMGVSIDGSYISSNLFLNVFAGGAIELLTGPAAWLLASKVNRLSSLTILYILSTITMIASVYIPRSNLGFVIFQVIMGCSAKFMLTTAFCIVLMYLPEVFPTTVRSLAMFISIGIGSLANVLAPTMNMMNIYFNGLSSIIYGILCLLSAGLIYWLMPETKGCPLPQNIEDGKSLRKGNEENYKNDYISKIESAAFLTNKVC